MVVGKRCGTCIGNSDFQSCTPRHLALLSVMANLWLIAAPPQTARSVVTAASRHVTTVLGQTASAKATESVSPGHGTVIASALLLALYHLGETVYTGARTPLPSM